LQSQWFETFFQGVAVEFWIRAIPHTVTVQEADYLERALELTPGARLLDIPCGHGRHAVELARRGYRVTAVDLSDDALDRARQTANAEGANIDWRRGDMREISRLDLPPAEFEAVYCFGNSFGYLDNAGIAVFLSSLARVLKPGGRIAIDTGVTAESILPALLAKRWHQFGDIIVLSETNYVAEESRLDIAYTFIHKGSMETRPSSSYIFTAAELKRMLGQAGFEAIALNGGLSGEPYRLGTPRLVIIGRLTEQRGG
jgi:SAM-dependent methyltransferase